MDISSFSDLIVFIFVGALAQLIDGGIGMGYGIFSNTLLLSFGFPPAISSGAVHTAEVFTTGASGFFHWKEKNVEKKLFFALLIPGVLGAGAGAFLLSQIDAQYIKPFIAIYLFTLGALILRKAFRKIREEDLANRFFPIRIIRRFFLSVLKIFYPTGNDIPLWFTRFLGGIGGFLDALGGGGWGPVVTSTLVAKDHDPRYTIGSVNAVEFFVTLTTSLTIFFAFGIRHWQIIVGLLLGGLMASPISAKLCKKIPPRFLMLFVGLLVVLLSVWTFFLSLQTLFPFFLR